MTEFPPEPWYLGGSLLVSAFLVPRELIHAEIPDGRKPLRLGKNIVVGVAFVNYVPGGVLTYDELLVAVPSLPGSRVTIPQIWVTSAASMAGGRELWGIPKQLADFSRTDSTGGSEVSMGSTASLTATYGRTLVPGMRQVALTTLQHLDGRRFLSRNRVIGRIVSLRTQWTFDPNGDLSYLAGRKPFFSAAIRDASVIFGMDVERS